LNLPRVMIGMPVGSGSIPLATAVSLLTTVRVCDREGLGIQLSMPVGSSVVTWARDAVVGAFLSSECTHLFWIDSDIVWRPADFLRLVGFGASHDMIGATYMLKRDPPVCVVNLPDPEHYEINGHGNVRVESLAMGFTLCKRAVIEKIAATKDWMFDDVSNTRYPDFFRLSRNPETGKPLGEDIAFYQDAAALGFKGWLDPSIKLGHVGTKEYTGDVIAALGLEQFAKQEKQQ
jgi:hypothetical protein